MHKSNSGLGYAALAALVAGCGAGDPADGPFGESADGLTVCAKGEVVEGVDVSGYQPNTDWAPVRASGRRFAIVKSTEGTGYTNKYFKQDWDGLKAQGMVRGAYHFFRSNIDGVAQADYMLSVMPALGPGDLPPTLDLETTDGQSAATIAKQAGAFLDRLAQKTGRKPMIYTSPSFWNSTVGNPAGFDQKAWLWIANWGVSCPNVPGDWKDWPFWQYSDTGNVPGIQGGVDHDRFNGSFADLMAFTGGGGATGTPAQVTGNDAMSIVSWPSSGVAEVFLRTRGGHLVHTWSKGAADDWNDLGDLGEGAACGLAAGFWSSKAYAEVFTPKADGTTLHTWLDLQNGWQPLSEFGGQGLSHLSTLARNDGRIEVFALGEDHAIWHRALTDDGSAWSDWASLGGTMATGPSAILWGDGHAEIFATDAAGVAWHRWSGDTPGGWFDWASMGGELATRPVPMRWADGHLEVFSRGKDNRLYRSAYVGGWAPFSSLGGTLLHGEPSVIANGDQGGATPGPEVFARDASDNVVHLWWDGAAYTDFVPLGAQNVASDPFGWVRLDGTAEVFAVDDAGALVRSARTVAGEWAAWSPIGGTDLDPCPAPAPIEPEPDAGAPIDAGAGGQGAGGGDGGAGAGGAATDDGTHPVVEPPADSGGGCGCRVADAPGRRSAAWLTLAAFGAVALRRRRGRPGTVLAVVREG